MKEPTVDGDVLQMSADDAFCWLLDQFKKYSQLKITWVEVRSVMATAESYTRKLKHLCLTCGRLLDQQDDATTEDCGGDCLRCMAELGDPDCIAKLKDATTAMDKETHDEGSADLGGNP